MKPGRRTGSWTLDLSLDNEPLYRGCDVVRVGGRLALRTEYATAATAVACNALRMAEAVPRADRRRLTLHGDAPVWAFLVACHMLHHAFDRVDYRDGCGRVPVSAFGW